MIDAHLHLGEDLVYEGFDTSEEMILNILETCNLDGCVIYPANSNISLEIERKHNERVRKFFSKYPNKIFGICQLNPNYEKHIYMEEVKKYKVQGFRGISVNPQIYGWDPLSRHGEVVFETASELDMPLFIAVGIGLPLGQPIRLYDLCSKYSNVKVVLVHADKSYCGNQCEILIKECPNVFLETSLGPNMRLIKKYIKRYGANRVIMGSCHLSLVEHSIYTFEHCGINGEEKSWATDKTICHVLGIEGSEAIC